MSNSVQIDEQIEEQINKFVTSLIENSYILFPNIERTAVNTANLRSLFRLSYFEGRSVSNEKAIQIMIGDRYDRSI